MYSAQVDKWVWGAEDNWSLVDITHLGNNNTWCWSALLIEPTETVTNKWNVLYQVTLTISVDVILMVLQASGLPVSRWIIKLLCSMRSTISSLCARRSLKDTWLLVMHVVWIFHQKWGAVHCLMCLYWSIWAKLMTCSIHLIAGLCSAH